MTTVMKYSQLERAHLCVSAATFGQANECSIYSPEGLQGLRTTINIQLCGKAQQLSLLSVQKAAEICYMLIRDDFLLLSPKMPQGLCMPVCVQTQAVYATARVAAQWQKKWLHYVLLLHDMLFSASLTIFSKLSTISICYKPRFSYNYAMHGQCAVI